MGSMGAGKNRALDIYRDTPLRYLGYLGLFGVNRSRVLPLELLRMSCLTYIVTDLYDKTKGVCDLKNKILPKAGEVTLFHLGSSILIPGVVMSGISNGLARQNVPSLGGIVPLAIFMAMAPIVGKFIDSGTDGVLNSTYRKIMGISPVYKSKDQERRDLLDKLKCTADDPCSPPKKPPPPCPPKKCCSWRRKKCPPETK